MSNLNTTDATAALQILADTSARRTSRNSNLNPASAPDSDDENDSSSPLFDTFYHCNGSAAILSLTNFTPTEFHSLWDVVEDVASRNWNVGRGRKSPQKSKDVFLMVLTVAKFAGKWDFLAHLFKMKTPSFEKLVLKFLEIIAPTMYDSQVKDVASSASISTGASFQYFPHAKYATDVTFQHTNRPSGNHEESKSYFSGKHRLYGYKCEVSVLPSGLAIGFTKHYAGSISDIDILHRNIRFHRWAAKKKAAEDMEDNGDSSEEYPTQWAILVDKGYQGGEEFLRVIHPVKKPKGKMLTVHEQEYNRAQSSDRIIVENFFGRLCNLWGLVGNKYRWKEGNYDLFFGFCVALTNFHARIHPLRNSDGEDYSRYKLRLYTIGQDISKKRKLNQEAYRERRRQRLSIQFRGMNASDDEDTQQPPSIPHL